MTKARAGAGASRLRLGQFKQAERDFTELLEATPNDPYIAYLLATTRHWQKDYSGAVSAYKKSIDVLPQSSPNEGFASGISGWPILPQEVIILEI